MKPEQGALTGLPSEVGVNQVRAAIFLAVELVLDEGTRGGLVKRVGLIRDPCTREQIALAPSLLLQKKERNKNGRDEEANSQTITETASHPHSHFPLSLSNQKPEPYGWLGTAPERKRGLHSLSPPNSTPNSAFIQEWLLLPACVERERCLVLFFSS